MVKVYGIVLPTWVEHPRPYDNRWIVLFLRPHTWPIFEKHWAFWCSPIQLQKIKFYWSMQPVGLPVSFWLVVSSPLKNISQWEGLSHILWKNKKRFQATNQVLLKYTTSWLTSWSWSAWHGHCNHYCRWLWQGNRPAVDALKPTPVSNGASYHVIS